jgi:hypothetical protein
VFLYLVTTAFEPDLRGFLQRHRDLLAVLPGWTVRLLIPRERQGLTQATEQAALTNGSDLPDPPSTRRGSVFSTAAG